MSGFGVDRGAGAHPSLLLDRRAAEGKPNPPRRTHGEADPQARTGEECCRLVEDHTERLGSVPIVQAACKALSITGFPAGCKRVR